MCEPHFYVDPENSTQKPVCFYANLTLEESRTASSSWLRLPKGIWGRGHLLHTDYINVTKVSNQHATVHPAQ